MGTHMPYEITQYYLPPGRGDILALAPAEAGTRFSNPGARTLRRDARLMLHESGPTRDRTHDQQSQVQHPIITPPRNTNCLTYVLYAHSYHEITLIATTDRPHPADLLKTYLGIHQKTAIVTVVFFLKTDRQ